MPMQTRPISETGGPRRPSVRCFIARFLSFGLDVRWSLTRQDMVRVMFPLNLPNALTVMRIMLVPVLVVALLGNTPAGDVLAAVVFVLASLTDFVDGRLARARDSVTTFGKLMDPPAGKLLVIPAPVSLVSLHR